MSTASASPRAPSHAERCRTLMAEARGATLATFAREPAGFPFASLVSVAAGDQGEALLLLSTLAEHTQNLIAREEASLLCTEAVPEGTDPLALGRVTLIGRCRRLDGVEVEPARARFLAAHPEAAAYHAFGDFGLWCLRPEALRYVGGFGRMSWVDPSGYRSAEPDPLRAAAADILAHMNQDHGQALLDYARGLGGVAEATAATMVRVDRYGFEMVVRSPDSARPLRLPFGAEVTDPEGVRRELVALVKEARARRA